MMWLVENMFFIESGMILDILFNFYGYLFRMIIGKFVLLDSINIGYILKILKLKGLKDKFWLNKIC